MSRFNVARPGEIHMSNTCLKLSDVLAEELSHIAKYRESRLDNPDLFKAPKPPSSLRRDRKSTRLNSSHVSISYAVFCLKKQKNKTNIITHIKINKKQIISRLRILLLLITFHCSFIFFFFFFFNDTATTEIYTLSLHDALPIASSLRASGPPSARCTSARTPARTPGRTQSSKPASSCRALITPCRLAKA